MVNLFKDGLSGLNLWTVAILYHIQNILKRPYDSHSKCIIPRDYVN